MPTSRQFVADIFKMLGIHHDRPIRKLVLTIDCDDLPKVETVEYVQNDNAGQTVNRVYSLTEKQPTETE